MLIPSCVGVALRVTSGMPHLIAFKEEAGVLYAVKLDRELPKEGLLMMQKTWPNKKGANVYLLNIKIILRNYAGNVPKDMSGIPLSQVSKMVLGVPFALKVLAKESAGLCWKTALESPSLKLGQSG